MKEILDLKKKERLFIEKNIADINREELKETYKVDDKTLDKIIQDGAHEGSPYITIPNFDLEEIDLVFSVHNYLTNTELEYDTIKKFLKEKQFISLSEVYYRLVTDSVLRDFPRNTGIWRKYPVLTPYYGDFPPNLHFAGEIPRIYNNFAMAIRFCELLSCNNPYSALFSCLLACFYFRSIVT